MPPAHRNRRSHFGGIVLTGFPGIRPVYSLVRVHLKILFLIGALIAIVAVGCTSDSGSDDATATPDPAFQTAIDILGSLDCPAPCIDLGERLQPVADAHSSISSYRSRSSTVISQGSSRSEENSKFVILGSEWIGEATFVDGRKLTEECEKSGSSITCRSAVTQDGESFEIEPYWLTLDQTLSNVLVGYIDQIDLDQGTISAQSTSPESSGDLAIEILYFAGGETTPVSRSLLGYDAGGRIVQIKFTTSGTTADGSPATREIVTDFSDVGDVDSLTFEEDGDDPSEIFDNLSQ